MFIRDFTDDSRNSFKFGAPGSDQSAFTGNEGVDIRLAGGSNHQRLNNAVLPDRNQPGCRVLRC